MVVDGLGCGTRVVSAAVREGRQRDPGVKLVLPELRRIVGDSRPESLPTTLKVAV